CRDDARPQAGLPRKIFAGSRARSDRAREGHVLPLRPDHPADDPRPSEGGGGMLNGWKVIVGGAALPRALAQEAMQRGIDITTGYGMSETCPVLTLAHLRSECEGWDVDRQVEVRIKAGRPIPLVDIRVVDTEMRDVPADGTTPGEIVARAPWLT